MTSTRGDTYIIRIKVTGLETSHVLGQWWSLGTSITICLYVSSTITAPWTMYNGSSEHYCLDTESPTPSNTIGLFTTTNKKRDNSSSQMSCYKLDYIPAYSLDAANV
ncbi:hypothetical protein TNCV_2975871 [Trichonephila clavipes]|nr:hypothetical protein TNCV_2975871 [Trichonephila clavipes]